MEALVALLLTNIGKFLNYLNINPRLQNKIMTIVSVFPTLYILRIVRGYFSNENYIKGSIYLIVFIILTYFIVINFVYYFKDRKVKWDVTNFIENIVPEDLTFDNPGNTSTSHSSGLQGKQLPLIFNEDSPFIIEQIIVELIQNGTIATQDLETNNFLIDKYTLIPFYKIRNQSLWIGSDYRNMQEIAKIKLSEDADTLIPLGVFILGGTHQIDGITYKEPYTVQLQVKSEEEEVLEIKTRSNKKKKKK